MTFESLLINTCDVERFTDGLASDYGTPAKTWAAIHEDEPCRHVSGKGREVKIGQEVVIVYDELFVGEIDITEQDRVVIGTDTYQVLAVVARQDGREYHHRHCFLEIIK